MNRETYRRNKLNKLTQNYRNAMNWLAEVGIEIKKCTDPHQKKRLEQEYEQLSKQVRGYIQLLRGY